MARIIKVRRNNMEKIIKIEEITFEQKETGSNYVNHYDGFVINTDKQVIKLGIENGQACCEHWGYFMTQDDLSDFVGANLIGITLTDTALNTKDLDDNGVEEGECMFVNINTDKGLLQFVAYNIHNGYYGHQAIVVSETLNHEVYL